MIDKFSSLPGFSATYGDWDLGGGLAAMLVSALVQSGRFVVIERANLERITYEQQLKAGSSINPETGPQLGKLTGAQFVVMGAITEFGVRDKGGGVNLGFMGMNNLGGMLGARQTEGAVGIDFRVVDTTSGQVVQTATVKEPISETSVTVGVDYRGMTLGGESFNNTPLGGATRRAIERAVANIVATSEREPWQALVVDFDGLDMAINAGSAAGVQVGDRFSVERITQKLTDPATGELLSARRRPLGTLVVKQVEPKLAFGAFNATDPEKPARSDVVVLMPK